MTDARDYDNPHYLCDKCAPTKPANWRLPDWWIALDESLPCKCECGARANWMIYKAKVEEATC